MEIELKGLDKVLAVLHPDVYKKMGGELPSDCY